MSREAPPRRGDQWSTVVERSPANLRQIRRGVSDFVRGVGLDDDASSDVALVVSELATNVVMHSTFDTIHTTVIFDDGVLAIEVGPVAPELEVGQADFPDHDVETGRGLALVRALTDELGTADREFGRVVRCVRGRPGVG